MPRTPSRQPDPAGRLGGRQELGQNLLIDKRFPAAMTDILRHAPPRPVLELGAGDGAVTAALLELGSPVTAVEIDPRATAALRRRFNRRIEVVEADLLAFDYGPRPHHVVSNVPFGITAPLLRRLLPAAYWHTAVLLVQWEVARKRAGVGGTTLLTAMWWPWYEFSLAGRVPAGAFHPIPAVDGGILVIRRREHPLLDVSGQSRYQRLVRDVFTGPGSGLAGVLQRRIGTRVTRDWLAREGLSARSLPRELTAADWVSLYQLGGVPPGDPYRVRRSDSGAGAAPGPRPWADGRE